MIPAIIAGGVALAQMGASMYNASQDRKAAERLQQQKQNAINWALDKSNSTYDQMMNKLNAYNNSRIKLADDNAVNEYKALMANYDPNEYVYDFDKFNYDKSVDDFMNPEAEKIAELAGLKTQAGLASQGAAKGTGALANMGYSRWEAARDLYKDAQQQMNQDRANAYQEYGDYIDRMQKKLDTINTSTMNRISMLGGAVQSEQQAQGDYMSDLLNIMGDRAATNVNATVGAF